MPADLGSACSDLNRLGQVHALDLSHREEEKKPVWLIGRSRLGVEGFLCSVGFVQQEITQC